VAETQHEVVAIDCKHVVSWFKHEDSQFKELYRRMQASFEDKNYGYRVCLHEAAHAVLMELDGIKNVRFTGPEIIYDQTIDRCVGAGGRATGDDQPEVEITDEYIFQRTMHMAAGGVALRMLGGAKAEDTGEGGDYQDFKRLYRKNPPSNNEPLEVLWKRAQEAVATKLNDEMIQATFFSKADEYFQQLYPARKGSF
jgi:hypothetical protein